MTIKSKEYSDYAKPELDDKLRQLEEELFNLKFQSKTTKLDKSHKIKFTRKDIARVKTYLRKLELKEKSKAKVISK